MSLELGVRVCGHIPVQGSFEKDALLIEGASSNGFPTYRKLAKHAHYHRFLAN